MGKIINMYKEKMQKFDDFVLKGQCEFIQDYTTEDKDNKMHCSKCGKPLGFWRMYRRARKVKKGLMYVVICKHCKYMNERSKGEIYGKK